MIDADAEVVSKSYEKFLLCMMRCGGNEWRREKRATSSKGGKSL
jgi:hypothetical protein